MLERIILRFVAIYKYAQAHQANHFCRSIDICVVFFFGKRFLYYICLHASKKGLQHIICYSIRTSCLGITMYDRINRIPSLYCLSCFQLQIFKPPFLIASSLILAQAQRLYRKLCPLCKKPAEIDPDVLSANQIAPAFFEGATLFEAGGCPKCNNIGFNGRGAFMEVLQVSEAIRGATVKGSPADIIRSIAIQEGMATLKDVGLMKVRDGVTSLRAALEVTGSE